jgi:hypothetical protein
MENPQLQIALKAVKVDIVIKEIDVDLCQLSPFKEPNLFIQ